MFPLLFLQFSLPSLHSPLRMFFSHYFYISCMSLLLCFYFFIMLSHLYFHDLESFCSFILYDLFILFILNYYISFVVASLSHSFLVSAFHSLIFLSFISSFNFPSFPTPLIFLVLPHRFLRISSIVLTVRYAIYFLFLVSYFQPSCFFSFIPYLFVFLSLSFPPLSLLFFSLPSPSPPFLP